jgi:hypothetical protein
VATLLARAIVLGLEVLGEGPCADGYACLETILVGRTEMNSAIKTSQCCFPQRRRSWENCARAGTTGGQPHRAGPPVILICDSLFQGETPSILQISPVRVTT